MKFKIDENLPIEAAATLRHAGFDAETVLDETCRVLEIQAWRPEYGAKSEFWSHWIWISPTFESTRPTSMPAS